MGLYLSVRQFGAQPLDVVARHRRAASADPMQNDAFDRLSELFDAASGLDADARGDFVARVRQEDDALAERLADLLRLDVAGTSGLDLGVGSMLGAAVTRRRPGERVGRYTLCARIGSGASGEVFRATVADDASGLDGRTTVALKILHPELVYSERALASFRREARRGSDVVHPNVARTFEAGSVTIDRREVHFLSMELVEGRTLRAVIDEDGPLSETRCRHIGAAVARGLGALHEAGIVHRDVKPDNLVITPDDVVKVTDLGISVDPEQLREEAGAGVFTGTVAYAAPEQLHPGGTVDARTDLFSLGVVLTGLLTGRHPHRGESVAATVAAVLDGRAARPSDHRDDLTQDVDELIARLLAKSPRHRVDDAASVVDALESGRTSSWWRDHGSRALDARLDSLEADRTPELRGRRAERETLRAVLAELGRGRGGSALVSGPSGCGATRLLDEALSDALRSGASFDIDVLTSQRLADLTPVASADDRPSADRLVAAMVEELRQRASRRPLVIVVDDLDRRGELFQRVFLSLARHACADSLVVLGVANGAVAERIAPLVVDLAGARIVQVAALAEESVARILRDRLRNADLAAQLLSHVVDHARGSPRAVHEIVNDLAATGVVAALPDGSWFAARVLADLPPPRSMQRRVETALESLSKNARRCVETVACHGADASAELIATAVELTVADVKDGAGQGRVVGLVVTTSGGDWRCRSEGVATRVREILTESSRTAIHRALARACAHRTDHCAPDELAAELCVHAMRANVPELLGDELDRGVHALARRGRYAEVSEVCGWAADLDGIPAVTRVARLLESAVAAECVGDVERRFELLERALAAAAGGAPESVTHVHLAICFASGDAGDLGRLERHARVVLDSADSTPDERGAAYRCLALAATGRGRPADAIEIVERALELPTTALEEGAQRAVLSSALTRMRRLDEGREQALHSLRLLDLETRPRAFCVASLALEVVERRQGRHDAAAAALERAHTAAERSGRRQIQALVHMTRGQQMHSRLDYPGARRVLASGASLHREFGVARPLPTAMLGDLARAAGDWDAAHRLLNESLDAAHASRVTPGEFAALGFLARLALDRAEYSVAREHALAAVIVADRIGDPRRSAIAQLGVASALVPLGEIDEAEDLTSTAGEVMARSGGPHVVTVQGLLCATSMSRGDREAALRHAEAALAAAERCNLDEARADARRFSVSVLLEDGQTDRARKLVRELRRLTRRADLPGVECVALSVLARLSGPPADPALVRRARSLLETDGERMPLHDRAEALLHLHSATDDFASCSESTKLVELVAERNPGTPRETLLRGHPALARLAELS